MGAHYPRAMSALQRIGTDLWVADGPISRDLLVVPYPTRMAVARLADGSLWITSPVPRTHQELAALTELGPVGHLLSPTPRHHWRLESWHSLFPEATLWSCALGPATLGRHSLPARRLTERAPEDWAGQIDQIRLRGLGFEEITFYHRASRTLLVEDLVQEHRLGSSPLVDALIRVGGIGPDGGVPRDMRLLAPKRALRRWARTLLSWDVEQVVVAHGPVIRTDAAGWLRRALGPLADQS